MRTSDDKQAMLDAVNSLILGDQTEEFFSYLLTAVNAAARAPIRLTGAAAVLNPLVELRGSNPDGYNQVLGLIDRRRATIDRAPLATPRSEGYDKVGYMRAFMDQKRERQKRAVEIENLLRPEKDRLVGNARLEFMRLQSVRWKAARDRVLAETAEKMGGQVTQEVRRVTLDFFWAAIDELLEDRLEEAKKARIDPAFRPRSAEDEMAALVAALRLPSR